MTSHVDRRDVLRTLAQLAVLALPLGCTRRPAAAAGIEIQPMLAQTRRLIEAMRALGEPFPDADVAALTAAENSSDPAVVLAALDRLVGGRCLAEVRINPEARVSIVRGPAEARLVEQGWRAFLVKVRNEAGVTGRLAIESPQARPVYRPATGNAMAPPSVRPADIVDRWLALEMFDDKPHGAAAVRARPRISHRRALQPRSRQARGAAGRDRGQRQRGHRPQEPRRDRVPRRSVRGRDVPDPRRERPSRGRVAARRGSRGTRLSGTIQTSRAGLLLPAARLSRRRRDAAAAGRRVHGDLRARAGVRAGAARASASARRPRRRSTSA